jgi:transposase
MEPGPPRSEAEWRAEIADLRALVERLGAQLNEQAEIITALKRENEQLKRENEQLRHENALLLRRVLGPTSEKMPSVSQELRRKKPDDKQDGKAKRRANKTLRGSQKLDTEEHEHRVPDAQRRCPNCPGVTLEPLGEPETAVEYEYVPARFKRRVHRREKLCCPKCKSHVVTAPAPLKAFDKSRYGAGFISHLVVTKCADAVPLYRQAKQLVRIGVPVARSTMTDLFHRAAAALRPLVERMLQIIAQATHVQGDETSFRVQEPVKCRRGFIWTFIGAGLIAYRFSADRSGETPQQVLGGTQGKLLVDGYTGYNHVCEVDGRERAGCLAHCRRKFFEALPTAPVEARHAMDQIVEVYAVEHEAQERDLVGTDEHRLLRQTKSKPVMDALHVWLLEQQPLHLPKSPIAVAIGYAINQWKPLTRFLDDPQLPVDNNESERRLRLVAMGRRNYLFAGDDEGAENLAILMSLVVTCEAHDINPEEYLADVLLRIQVHPQARIDDLLPPVWHRLREAGELAPLPSTNSS